MIRICAVCGKPVTAGMTDVDGNFYVHEGDCFEKYMDDNFGKHRWMEIVDDFEGGYYIASDDSTAAGYYGTGIFYTEWKDEEGETE